MSDEKVILVVGARCLDRLLSVIDYPEADTKVRTTAYHEIGGGNAANTAPALALLKDAEVFSGSNLSVKLLTKLGDDYVGKQKNWRRLGWISRPRSFNTAIEDPPLTLLPLLFQILRLHERAFTPQVPVAS